MPARIVVVAEAEIDRRHACELIDRKVLHHAPDWLDAQQLEQERSWSGIVPGTRFTRWKELKSLSLNPGALRGGGLIGFKRSGPRHFDYLAARKALVHCALRTPRADAVVLMRDMDDRPSERAASIKRAAEDTRGASFIIMLALPISKREAWSLNGFVAQSTSERRLLDDVRAKLGFDPCSRAESLDAMMHGAKRDAKRVLNQLTGGVGSREAKCWQQTEWKVLRERGEATQLSDFLVAVRDQLVPLVTGKRPKRRAEKR